MIFSRVFIDLYKDIVDIASFDILSLVNVSEIYKYIKSFKNNIDKIRRNIGRIKAVLDKSRSTLKKIGIDIPLDISDILKIATTNVSFLKITPEIAKKQKLFGGTIFSLVDTTSRTAKITGDITKLITKKEKKREVENSV